MNSQLQIVVNRMDISTFNKYLEKQHRAIVTLQYNIKREKGIQAIIERSISQEKANFNYLHASLTQMGENKRKLRFTLQHICMGIEKAEQEHQVELASFQQKFQKSLERCQKKEQWLRTATQETSKCKCCESIPCRVVSYNVMMERDAAIRERQSAIAIQLARQQ